MDVQWFGLVAATVLLGFMAFVPLLAILWYRTRSEARLREFEIRYRVLEKFADSEAFLEFARSEEGRRLLLGSPEPARSGGRAWQGLLYVGLLVFALGIGARIVSAGMPDGKETWDRYRKHNLATWDTLCVCAGIALTGSGALSRWLDRR